MTRIAKHENEILKEIESGKFRNHYLVYNRKSTDDTDNQKNSIKYQKAENARFAARQKFQIAPITLVGFATDGVISERHSAFKEDLALTFGRDNTVRYRVERPKFHRLVQWLSQRYFKGVIFLCWDRASRNKGDETILRKLMKAGVDVRFTLAQYDKSSSGELHMDIDGMFSEHHSRVTREKVTLAIRRNREEGLCTHRAPVGYLNTGDVRHKPLDPVRAPIIKALFEKAATGGWSLADLTRWAISQGLTMPPVRRARTEEERLAEEEDDIRLEIEPVSHLPKPSVIHFVLTNPFYTGKVRGNDGVMVPSASHAALVSDELFRKVQLQLRGRRTSARYSQVIDHPLRRMVLCGTCGRVYTPYQQKGIVYYGARCGRECSNPTKSFNLDFIFERIGHLIDALSFTDREREEIEARASTDIALLEAKRLARLEDGERRKKKIREDLAYLHANRLFLLRTGAYTAEALVEEETRLQVELNALCEEEQASDSSMEETVREVVKLSELLKNGSAYYRSANPSEKDEIIRVIFSELRLSENTLTYKCRNGFGTLESRFVQRSALNSWLSELACQHELVLLSLRELAPLLRA